jgi:excisionase family DNA binding protein
MRILQLQLRPYLSMLVRTKDAEQQQMTDHIPFRERKTCTPQEACVVTGLGRSSIWQAMSDGKLKYTSYGKRRLIYVKSLLKMLKQNEA